MLKANAIKLVERIPLPDLLVSAGINWLVGRTRSQIESLSSAAELEFVAAMSGFPIATAVDAANSQHYALPPDLFVNMLGPKLKYSCCLFETATASLADAEISALHATTAHADLADNQDIMEWGCGWGSLTLHMGEKFQNARILAVTNSPQQQSFVAAQAAARKLANVQVQCTDMNTFHAPRKFDRLVSVEMFEHMSNWRALLSRARDALKPDGKLLLHIFTHRSRSYRFNPEDPTDWIARHFFTGGMMPARDLPKRFDDLFTVENEWHWSGTHYRRTAQAWLENFDKRRSSIDPILTAVYGHDADLWRQRWRLFLLATMGLFGHANGGTWGVGQYRLAPLP